MLNVLHTKSETILSDMNYPSLNPCNITVDNTKAYDKFSTYMNALLYFFQIIVRNVKDFFTFKQKADMNCLSEPSHRGCVVCSPS